MSTTLVVRLDSAGDVLLAGPAIRAVAAGSDRVIMLCGPAGFEAAGLLPGVDEAIVWACPWVVADPPAVQAHDVADVVARIGKVDADAAIIFTSFHQSPLATALVLRLAGIPRIAAVSEDYPGALLDLRHRLPEQGLHEVERMVSLAETAGFPAPPNDRRLSVRRPLPDPKRWVGADQYVVVHPGASAPARAWSPNRSAALVERLAETVTVVVTGGPAEIGLTARVAGRHGVDLGGELDLRQLAGVLAGADVLVVGNTGPAHLAAAVGTAVVSLFSPVVAAERWRPYGVPVVQLGDQSAACAGTRARVCPVAGHPCLDQVTVDDVLSAVSQLRGSRPGVMHLTAEVNP